MKMNRILLAGLFFSSVFMAKAQTEKGKVLLGINASFVSHYEGFKIQKKYVETAKTKNFNFSPIVGSFVTDHLVLGIGVPISYSQRETDNGILTKSTSALTYFMRKYFDTNPNHLKTYLQGGIGFGRMTEKYDSGVGPYPEPDIQKMLLCDLSFGLAFFLGEKVSLDVGVGYSSVTLKPKKYTGDERKIISNGFSSTMGIVMVL